MQWFKLRPTFQYELTNSQQHYLDKLASEARRLNQPQVFLMHGEYGELHLSADQHRLWSPHLSFYIEPNDQHATLHGRFAPRVEIWTTVWIFYLAMSFSAFFAFTLAFSQWMIGEAAWGAWVGLAAIVSIIFLYAVAHIGQQWSVDQMHDLRDRLDSLLAESQEPDGSTGLGIGESKSSSPSLSGLG